MRLEKWLQKHDFTPQGLSDFMHVPKPTVLKWVYGRRVPRPDLELQIRKLTKHAVTAIDFNDHYMKVRKQRQKGRRKRKKK